MSEELSVDKTGPTSGGPDIGLRIAWGWAAVATVLAIALFSMSPMESYGGDAYTGIQNAAAWTARGVAFLIFATGPLGLITAYSRRK